MIIWKMFLSTQFFRGVFMKYLNIVNSSGLKNLILKIINVRSRIRKLFKKFDAFKNINNPNCAKTKYLNY